MTTVQPHLYHNGIEAMQSYNTLAVGEHSIEESAHGGNTLAQRVLADANLRYTVQEIAPIVDLLKGKDPYSFIGVTEHDGLAAVNMVKEELQKKISDGKADKADFKRHTIASMVAASQEGDTRIPDVIAFQGQLAEEIKAISQFAPQPALTIQPRGRVS